LTDAFRTHAREMGWAPARLDGFDFATTLTVDRDRATWTAPNLLAAFVSISFAASHLRGEDNWALVTKGYDAFMAGRHEHAIELYEQALHVNPDDAATRCRIGAAHQALGRLHEARTGFRHGFEHDEEIGDAAMRSWCAIGLAETELAAGNVAAAREAARRVLALPDLGGKRHARAQTILTTIERPGT
jgi:tetratricopeptide (TPR) repeat protein